MVRASACLAAFACSVALSSAVLADPPTPAAKPTPSAAEAAPAAQAAPAATVATYPPMPRRKPPPYPPVPRSKPDAPVEVAKTDEPYVAPAGTAVAAKPLATKANEDGYPCGDACGEILFQVVDDCLWVQSQNPRPIVFQASVTGKMLVLPLEGASAAKADARTTVAMKGSVPSLSAYHTRLKDPFQSSSPGLPVYRARLGGSAECVKNKADISAFRADFKK